MTDFPFSSHFLTALRTEAQGLGASERDSQVFPKKDTASCYKKAIDGEKVPELNLTAEQAESED